MTDYQYKVEAFSAHADAVLRIIQENSGGLLAGHLNPILNLTRNIPAYSGNFLEWHLNRIINPLDFICRVYDRGDGPLLTLNPVPFGKNLNITKGYQKLIDHSKNQFRYGIENVFFEYDFPNPGVPSVFFDMNRKLVAGPALKYDGLAEICGHFQFDLPPGLFELLTNIHIHGFSNLHFGLMLSRESKAIRLTVNRFESGRLNELIPLLGWNGDIRLVSDLQKSFFCGQQLMLAVDFDGQCGPRLGIELCQPNLETVLPQLESCGMIDPDQNSFLQHWNGNTELARPVAKALSILHQRPVDRIHKYINHFKFAVEGRAVSTKAYLYYCF
ncbi:hypothetical protein [Dyadobacter sp. NIV53]|uniref:hypothetical protein n=1 Tax=Dyadobacter sp. NIV53 TaxID=2861765 RepID=UPI001C87806C|nr:hypothetical protein [Dyadobacter sp. NIV53]